MITYYKKGLKVAEAYYDEPTAMAGADVLRYQNYAEPVRGENCQEFHTIYVDLTPTPEQILAKMHASTRREIRHAEHDGARCEFSTHPSDDWLAAFFAFFEEFAAGKGLPSPNRNRITGMRDGGILDLSRALDPEGNVIVWHCQYRAQTCIRLMHSTSLFRQLADKQQARSIARANRHLHYFDMLRFRESGYTTYDLGGWYAGKTDVEKLRINEFKASFGGDVVRVFNTDRGLTMKGVLAVYARQALGVLRGER